MNHDIKHECVRDRILGRELPCAVCAIEPCYQILLGMVGGHLEGQGVRNEVLLRRRCFKVFNESGEPQIYGLWEPFSINDRKLP